MKAISIQQPWGTLVACGLKDVENRKWAVKSLPMRVLIHTGARRQPMTDDNMPYPWYWYIENYQKMGILPPIEQMPTSAIVGVATIVACEEGNRSLWAMRGPGAEYQWVIKDARMFKKPITGVKGKLGFFEVPGISEDNLPECVDVTLPRREGTTLHLPVSRAIFDEISRGDRDSLTWNVVDDNLPVFADDALSALPTDKVVATDAGRELALDVCRYAVDMVCAEDGRPFFEEDDLGRQYNWYEAYMEFE